MKENCKTVLITGASSGIGKETAVMLAQNGYSVFAGVRRKSDKIELEGLHKNIKGVYIDITNSASIDKAFWFVLKNVKKLDVLINNAGIVTASPVEYLPIKNLKEQFEVNTFGAVACAQKFMQILSKGMIINISSMAATGIFPYISPYCASKRAADILFNSFAIENKDNIKVVSVKPACVKTPIWNKSVDKAKKLFEDFPESSKEKYAKELEYLKNNVLKTNRQKMIETPHYRTASDF